VRIALSAARAAKAFQPTRSRAAAPQLIVYYELLRPAAPNAIDVGAVSRTRPQPPQRHCNPQPAMSHGTPLPGRPALYSIEVTGRRPRQFPARADIGRPT